VLRAVVEQHAEDAAFLFTARETAVAAPHVRLGDLIRLDERLEANLDGLRIAGRAGAKIAASALAGGEAGEVFTSAVLACEDVDGDRLTRMIELAEGDDWTTGIAGALEWLPFPKVERALDRLRAAPSPIARRAALSGLAAHRRDARGVLDAALLDDDPRVNARALRAIGELRRIDRAAALEVGAQADEPESRFWAAWSATLLGDARGARVLQAMATHGADHAEASATVAAVALAPDDARSWIEGLAKDESLQRVTIRAVAALGDPGAIPILLEALEIPGRARAAADAFTTITGVAIEGDLAGAAPPDFASGPSDDPDDDDVTLDPDALLAWPRAAGVRAAWARRQKDFSRGVRYLLGRPVGREALLAALAGGRQPERARAAFELARAGEPLFDVTAPAHRQVHALRQRGIEPPTVLGSYD
jgi:uncharacterized protein (TIGR02270 family)